MKPEYRVNDVSIQLLCSDNEHNLMLKITQFNEVIINSFIDYAPHKICRFIYDF